jgi:hypothetical protein
MFPSVNIGLQLAAMDSVVLDEVIDLAFSIHFYVIAIHYSGNDWFNRIDSLMYSSV